jgi:magnesium-transporting ATPase (P-type)
MNGQFFQRRWLDFRNGHSTYLIFTMAFLQFVITTYTLGIERFEALKGVFPSMTVWAIVFVVIYVPAAVVIGYWHRKKQYAVENEALLKENWVWAWISMYQIRLIEGKVTPEETRQIKEFLEGILKRQKKDALMSHYLEDILKRQAPPP